MAEAQNELQPLLQSDDVDATPVYPLIQLIKADVEHYIVTPISYQHLTSPPISISVLPVLVEKYVAYQQQGNLSVTFCILLNRVHYLRDEDVFSATLSKSRADFCELLAIRVFRENVNHTLDLTIAATTFWNVYSGADPRLLEKAKQERDDDLEDRVGNALELAILGKAKHFTKSNSCRKVVESIWTGQCVYQAQNAHSILSDTYKRTPVHFYDPHKAPLLDHYRLKVPSIRAVLEYTNFVILFILYVIALEYADVHHFNVAEGLFVVYALGFTLEKLAAMQEHGIRVYFKGTWNAFDLAFVTTFTVYIMLRVYGIQHHKYWAKTLGIDTLALIACMLFPRLAFVTFKNNLMVLSLRAMIIQFVFLMCVAMFCFFGFLYALWTLGRTGPGFEAGEIAWWMLDLWFGLDASGFQNAAQFHRVLGPILMVVYACLSNTLLLTVLVSILSNTFAKINEDAAAEAMFRKTVLTIEGVKADSLFSYQPPINLFAVCVLLPAHYILSPRWFHKVNVFMIRMTNFPILLLVSFYERQAKAAKAKKFSDTVAHVAETVYDSLPKVLKRMSIFEGFAGSEGDIDAIFELEDDDDAVDLTEDLDPNAHGRPRQRTGSSYSLATPPRKRAVEAKRKTHSPSPTYKARAGLPRLHTSSLMRGPPAESMVSFSPLTQVYQQPLVFPSEDPAGSNANEDAPPTSATATSTALSAGYGAINRRRLNSIVPHTPGAGRRTVDPLLAQVQMNNAMRRFAGPGAGVGLGLGAASASAVSLSPPSPPERGGILSSGNGDTPHPGSGGSNDDTPTAVEVISPRGRSGERFTFGSSLQQVREQDGSGRGDDDESDEDMVKGEQMERGAENVQRRLDAIEKKQDRIESLLAQLVESMAVSKVGGT